MVVVLALSFPGAMIDVERWWVQWIDFAMRLQNWSVSAVDCRCARYQEAKARSPGAVNGGFRRDV